ncbi:MAG: hypothetical protein WCH99_04075 [Verrucomicrobiota bacterium]
MIATTLEEIACEMLTNGHAAKFRLMQMTNTPTTCRKHPLRYMATVATIGNQKFEASGNSPSDAIINALCQEKVSRQGWSDGDRRP